jgi:hypothetical protein
LPAGDAAAAQAEPGPRDAAPAASLTEAEAKLPAAFAQQVRWCLPYAPFTAAVLGASARHLAAHPEALRAVSAAAGAPADPLAAALPLRWAAGLHHLALLGLEPWRSLWPPAPGAAEVAGREDLMAAAVAEAWVAQQPLMRRALARAPQTNEVQRSVVLLPGLLHVAHETELPLALCEIGSSAGLNVWCDRWRHLHEGGSAPWAWEPAGAPLTLRCAWTGQPPPRAALQVVSRAGCDLHPVDLAHPGEALRLASFVWAEQRDRLARLQTAVAAVTRWHAAEGVAVESMPAAGFAARELARPRPGVATVLMHSVVWQYLPAAEQAAIELAVRAAGARAHAGAPLAWMRMEPPTPVQPMTLRCTIWPGGQDHVLARVHPHGLSVEWLR